MPLSSIDFHDASGGPNASLYGNSGRTQELNREVNALGGKQGGQPPGQPPGQPQGQPPGQPQGQPSQPPVQPPPLSQDPTWFTKGQPDPAKMTTQRGSIPMTTNERIQTWAAHPQAGQYLRAMARFVSDRSGKPPGQ